MEVMVNKVCDSSHNDLQLAQIDLKKYGVKATGIGILEIVTMCLMGIIVAAKVASLFTGALLHVPLVALVMIYCNEVLLFLMIILFGLGAIYYFYAMMRDRAKRRVEILDHEPLT
jgi:hypothetical protein